MALLAHLVAYGLRQVIGEPAELVVNVVVQRWTDHGLALPKALASANDRAWQALGVALAGDGFLDQVKVLFASGDDKGVRELVSRFLNSGAVPFAGTPVDFRKACLAELKQARKSGLLSADRLSAHEVARQTAAWQRFNDPQSLIAGGWRAVGMIAVALAPTHPNLAKLLKEPVPGGPPLLVAAFAYFFRREVETNDELANGLLCDGLRQLSAAQAKAFGEIGQALNGLGGRFDEMFDRLGGIESGMADVKSGIAGVTRQLDQLSDQIAKLAARNNVSAVDLKPQFHITINNENEQALARRLLAEVRKLPPVQQRTDDLSRLGDVLRAAGLFGEAKQSYAEAAGRTGDRCRQAANHYKEYLAALEQNLWEPALAAVVKAAALDDKQFAPFPLHQYEPKRILGAGGFGTAFLCRDRFMNQDVVVKSLHAADLDRTMEDVFTEAQTLLLLSRAHPAIIGVQTCGYGDPAAKARPYIVMDYFPGGSLETFVRQRGTLSPDDLINVARQICAGMKAAHERKILHRDLKPDNVLVRKEGPQWLVRLIDFGLAVRSQVVQASTSRPGSERTICGESAAGTAKYAPPEQMGGMPGVQPGPYSDVYAFGKLCYHALFNTTEPKDRHWKELPAAERKQTAANNRLRKLLEQCTEQDLGHRFPSFDPVLHSLENLEALQRRHRAEREREHLEQEERSAAARKAWATRREREERERQEQGAAEQTRLREEQERQQEETARREREEAERRKEAERQKQEQQARSQQEREAHLVRFMIEVFTRTQGRPQPADNAGAVALCKQHGITPERANQIWKAFREQWRKAHPYPGSGFAEPLG